VFSNDTLKTTVMISTGLVQITCIREAMPFEIIECWTLLRSYFDNVTRDIEIMCMRRSTMSGEWLSTKSYNAKLVVFQLVRYSEVYSEGMQAIGTA
jgi:hypothetical protein